MTWKAGPAPMPAHLTPLGLNALAAPRAAGLPPSAFGPWYGMPAYPPVKSGRRFAANADTASW